MIKRIYVNNYKCLVNLEVNLQPLQLILGRNGTGKSALIEVLYGIARLLGNGTSIEKIFPARSLTRWQKLNVQEFAIHVTADGLEYRYVLHVEHNLDQRLSRVIFEELSVESGLLFLFRNGEVQLYGDNHQPGPKFSSDWGRSALANVGEAKNNKKLIKYRKCLSQIFCIAPDPYTMESRSEEEDARPSLRFSNFVSWYRLLSDEYPEREHDLIDDLKQVMDGLISLPLISYGENVRQLNARQQLGETGNERIDYSFDELSDGQRSLIALYALFNLGLNNATSICLDEPDNYVALREIQPLLMSLQDRLDEHVDAQVLLISHNPSVIDYLAPGNGVEFYRTAAGATRVRPFKVPDGLTLSASEVLARGWEDE